VLRLGARQGAGARARVVSRDETPGLVLEVGLADGAGAHLARVAWEACVSPEGIALAMYGSGSRSALR
jgi:hypothetical protein